MNLKLGVVQSLLLLQDSFIHERDLTRQTFVLGPSALRLRVERLGAFAQTFKLSARAHEQIFMRGGVFPRRRKLLFVFLLHAVELGAAFLEGHQLELLSLQTLGGFLQLFLRLFKLLAL